MAISLDAFQKALTAAGILSADDLQAFVEAIPVAA